MFDYPAYPEAEQLERDAQDRRQTVRHGHASRSPSTSASCCSRRCRTSTRDRPIRMGRRSCAGITGKHIGDGGRPTVKVLQDMYRARLRSTRSSRRAPGTALRQPMPPPVIGDHEPAAAAGPADRRQRRPAGGPPAHDPRHPARDPRVRALDRPAARSGSRRSCRRSSPTCDVAAARADLPAARRPGWDLYMLCRKPLVLEGLPQPEAARRSRPGCPPRRRREGHARSSCGPTSTRRPASPCRCVALEPSGLDVTRGAPTQGYGLDPAYPRAMVTDLEPPFWRGCAPIDASIGPKRVRRAVAIPRPQHGRDAQRLGGAADARRAVRPGPGTPTSSWTRSSSAATPRGGDSRTPGRRPRPEAVSAELLPHRRPAPGRPDRLRRLPDRAADRPVAEPHRLRLATTGSTRCPTSTWTRTAATPTSAGTTFATQRASRLRR